MWSFEKLFAEIRQYMPADISVELLKMPCLSQGIFKRLRNTWFATFHQQATVNHITGDIHYIALSLKKNKTLLTIHDLGFMRQYKGIPRFLLWLFWIYLPVRRVRYVVAISDATKKEIIRYARCKVDKIRIIPDFVSPRFTFVPKDFDAERPVILQIGTKFNKNLERLFAALEGIPCRLVVVGELQKHQDELIKKHQIDCENKIGLTEEQIVACYCACDIVTFCSLLEGFGLPILEAQATGRSVITSNCSSMPEVAGGAAVLVNPTDIESIRNGILSVIRNQDLRDSLIVKGLENVKRFHPQQVAEQYASLYREIGGE